MSLHEGLYVSHRINACLIGLILKRVPKDRQEQPRLAGGVRNDHVHRRLRLLRYDLFRQAGHFQEIVVQRVAELFEIWSQSGSKFCDQGARICRHSGPQTDQLVESLHERDKRTTDCKRRRGVLTVLIDASMKPSLRPRRNVFVNRSWTSPLSIPRTRRIACSRAAQLCSLSLPYNTHTQPSANQPQGSTGHHKRRSGTTSIRHPLN